MAHHHPGLVPTIVLLTTLAMGNVLNAGFDQVFNMYNQLVIETGDIIDTYVYRIGITNMQFSLATAAGLFKSVVSFVLVVTSYVCAYKFADYKDFLRRAEIMIESKEFWQQSV